MFNVVISKYDGKDFNSFNITERENDFLVQSESQSLSDYNAVVNNIDAVFEICRRASLEEIEFAKVEPQIEVLTEAEIYRQVYNGR